MKFQFYSDPTQNILLIDFSYYINISLCISGGFLIMTLIMQYIFGAVWLVVWGFSIYNYHPIAIINTPIAHIISIVLFLAITFMWLYSIYHHSRYHRPCCWHCFLFEHNTCKLSHDSYQQSKIWKQKNK